MANGPALFYLDQLRKLQGAPNVTSPENNAGSLKIERVQTIGLSDPLPDYGDPDPDSDYEAAGARLTVRQVLGSDNLGQEVYTCYEALGTREQQDLWNEQPATYPYGSTAYPRINRKYRFFYDQIPEFVIGETTDTVFDAAILIGLESSDESAVVKILDASFDDIPTITEQATLGTGSDGLGISVSFEEGDNAFPVVSWAFRVLNGGYAPATNNEACPLPGYSSLVLTDQKRVPAPDASTVAVETRVYQILPGKVISSADAARLPRTLSAIPAYYLNGDKLITTKQKVPYVTDADALTGGILSSKVDATTSLMAVKTNVSRADPTLPTIYLPKQVEDAGGADGVEYRAVVEVDDPTDLTAAVDAAVALIKDLFHTLDYTAVPLSPTQTELQYTQVAAFPELVGAEFNSNIPDKFLTGFQLETDEDWIDTTTTPATAQLTTGPLVISCKITPETSARGKRVTTRLPAGSVFPTLTSVSRTEQGQYKTVVESITDGTTPLPTLTGLVVDETSQVAIGGGNFLRTVATVTDVFSEAEYTAEIPNPVPEKFRAGISTFTTASTTAGTAASPTLGAGELRRSVRQVTEQLIRTEVETLNLSSLPTLTSVARNEKGQYVTTVESIDDGTAALPTLSATTVDPTSLVPIGGGLFLRTISTVGDVFGGDAFTVEIPNVIPEEFRALATTATTETTTAGTVAGLPTLGTGELRRSVTQVDEQKIRTEVTVLNLAALPIMITGTRTNARKQTETITRTLQLPSPSNPIPIPNALTDVTVTYLGNGLQVVETVAISAVFSATSYTVEINDATPEEFRVLIPTETDEYVTTGTAAVPTLGTGDLRITQTQETQFTVRVQRTFRSLPTLPARLTSTQTNAQKQAVTVARTLQLATDSVPVPTALVDVRSTNLGNGTVVVETQTIGAVFTGVEYTAQRNDPTPEVFKVQAPILTTATTSAGTASAPTLGTGELRRTVRQVDGFTIRVEVESRNLASLPITIDDSRTNAQGEVEAVARTLQLDTDAIPAPTALTTVQVTNLGNGTVVVEVVTLPEVFSGVEYTTEVPIAIPDEFRALALTTTVGSTVPGTAAAPTLGAGEYRKTVRQVTKFNIRTETTALNLAVLPITLSSTRTNTEGQVETVARTLQLATSSVASPDSLTRVNTTNLGNGLVVVEVIMKPAVFAGQEYTTQRGDPTPEVFRGLAPLVETVTTSPGAASQPTLAAGDVRRTDLQVDEFTHRLTITTRAIVGTLTVTENEMVGGNSVTVTKTLTIGSQSFTPDYLTLDESAVEDLGNGTTLMTVRKVAAFNSQAGQSYDRKLGLVLPYTQQIESQSVAEGLVGTANREITPKDAERWEVKTLTPSTTGMDALFIESTVTIPRIDFPPILDAMVVEWETGTGKGDSKTTGVAAVEGSGTLYLNIPNSSQGSATVIPNVAPVIREVYVENVIAISREFLLPNSSSRSAVLAKAANGGATVNPWPLFQPVSHTFVCKGQKISTRASASAQVSLHLDSNGLASSVMLSNGTSADFDISSSTRAVTVRPTIHGAVNLSGSTTMQSDAATASAVADIAPLVSSQRSVSILAKASVSPSAIPATPGAATIPTTGLYLLRCDAEVYQDGYTLYRAVIVDFSTLSMNVAATAGTPQLALDDATDTGTITAYRMSLDDDGGGSNSVAPALVASPTTQTSSEGTDVTFTVTALGDGLTYQWRKDGTDIPGATASSYTVPSIVSGDAGSYDVVISNGMGSVTSDAATLTVADTSGSGTPPIITMQPVANINYYGGVVQGVSQPFIVAATGDEPLTYQWQKNGTDIRGATTANLFGAFVNFTVEDGDTFRCVVSNTNGSTTSSSGTAHVLPVFATKLFFYFNTNRSDAVLANKPLVFTRDPSAPATPYGLGIPIICGLDRPLPTGVSVTFDLTTSGAGHFVGYTATATGPTDPTYTLTSVQATSDTSPSGAFWLDFGPTPDAAGGLYYIPDATDLSTTDNPKFITLTLTVATGSYSPAFSQSLQVAFVH